MQCGANPGPRYQFAHESVTEISVKTEVVLGTNIISKCFFVSIRTKLAHKMSGSGFSTLCVLEDPDPR